MNTPLPLPGLHYGVSFSDYQSWDAVNYSTLKHMRGTASKCKWAMDHPKDPTDAMNNGQALHVATLEPGRFDGMFYLCPPCDGRTKEGKELLAHHTAAAAQEGKTMLRQGLKEDAGKVESLAAYRGMANAIHASKAASLFFKGQGQNEVTLLWIDPATGLPCKGRVDSLREDYVLEIKSTRNADDWSFGKDCFSMGYHIQAANYLQGLKIITGKRYGHVIVAVESAPPYDVKVHMLDDAAQQTGASQYNELLVRFAECKKTNQWPGYEDKVTTLSLPKYAEI